MPFSSELSGTQLPAVRVALSPIVELDWTLYAASPDHLCATHPVLEALYGSGDLAERVRSVWGDGPTCFPELILLASHARVLEAPISEALAAIERTYRSAPSDLPLRTESDAEAVMIRRRFVTLASDDEFARRYFALLAEVWSRVAVDWSNSGRRAALNAVDRLTDQLEGGLTWRDLLRRGGKDPATVDVWIDKVDASIDRAAPVLVVPGYFSGDALLLDAPEQLIVGIRAVPSPESRAHFEEVGRRLKAISDPTRLAILSRAAGGPVQVGTLARELSISQPTVSGHVKLLRAAGLLTEQRSSAGRRELHLEMGELETLMTSVLTGVGRAGRDDARKALRPTS